MTSDLSGLPPTVGRYVPQEVLGQGGMGRVLLAHDPVLKREVAIKLVEPGEARAEQLAELRFLFHREARAAAALQHPNILAVYDYSGPDAELPFLVCERVEGPTLRAVLVERGALPLAVVAAIGHELAGALAHAHQQGIVHRDVKPDNVFGTPGGRVILADFGVARAFDGCDRLGSTVTFGETSIYGSPAYLAPEQLAGDPPTPALDLHALGAVIFEMASGQPAFAGADRDAILAAVQATERPSLDHREQTAGELKEVVDALLRLDPAQRPATAMVQETLRGILDELEITDPREMLRDWLNDEERAVVEAPEPPTEIFADEPAEGIHMERAPLASPRSRWMALALRGPVVLGMLGFAILLGAAAYAFVSLDELPRSGAMFPGGAPEVADSASASSSVPVAPTIENSGDVFVRLAYAGAGEVWVDGALIGHWEDGVRLALAAGPHQIEVRFAEGAQSRQVLLLENTSPVFDFSPLAASDTPGPD